MNAIAASSILSVLCYYLLCKSALAIPIGHEGCPPSSCGSLKSISYPLRLKGDPPECGDPNYELICEGNNTVLTLHSGKYYVKEISYDNSTIRIVDANVASGSCRLPSLLFSEDEFAYSPKHTGLYHRREYGFISFVNCTRESNESRYDYKPIQCLSGNSSTVYSVFDPYDYDDDVDSLANSCSYIAMVPVDFTGFLPRGGNDIFDVLRRGFMGIRCPSIEGQGHPILLAECTNL